MPWTVSPLNYMSCVHGFEHALYSHSLLHACMIGTSTDRCLLCITSSSRSCCAVPNLDRAQTQVCQNCRLVSSEDKVILFFKCLLHKVVVHTDPCKCGNCNHCCLRPPCASGHLATANGAVALLDNFPSMDSTEVAQAKAYGAIILAHGNMAEWAFTNAISIGSGRCQIPLFCITENCPPPPPLPSPFPLRGSFRFPPPLTSSCTLPKPFTQGY